MTREEAEKRIRDLMIEIEKVVTEYSPNDKYWTGCIHATDGIMSFNNSWWNLPDEYKLKATYLKKGGEWSDEAIIR